MTDPTTQPTRIVLAEDSVLLRDGIVRTPMDPTATFTDDPLRILRCVRFGSRFGYAIHPDIFAALAAPASPLHAALASKVSRERVGIEVDKMLSGRDPRYALQLLAQLQLYWVVFMPPPALSQRMGRSSDHGAHIDELVHDAPDERAALSLSDCFDSLLRGTSPLWSRLPTDWLARVRRLIAQQPARKSVAVLPLVTYDLKTGKLVWRGYSEGPDDQMLQYRTLF